MKKVFMVAVYTGGSGGIEQASSPEGECWVETIANLAPRGSGFNLTTVDPMTGEEIDMNGEFPEELKHLKNKEWA